MEIEDKSNLMDELLSYNYIQWKKFIVDYLGYGISKYPGLLLEDEFVRAATLTNLITQLATVDKSVVIWFHEALVDTLETNASPYKINTTPLIVNTIILCGSTRCSKAREKLITLLLSPAIRNSTQSIYGKTLEMTIVQSLLSFLSENPQTDRFFIYCKNHLKNIQLATMCFRNIYKTDPLEGFLALEILIKLKKENPDFNINRLFDDFLKYISKEIFFDIFQESTITKSISDEYHIDLIKLWIADRKRSYDIISGIHNEEKEQLYFTIFRDDNFMRSVPANSIIVDWWLDDTNAIKKAANLETQPFNDSKTK